jgi:hypothetical protein
MQNYKGLCNDENQNFFIDHINPLPAFPISILSDLISHSSQFFITQE